VPDVDAGGTGLRAGEAATRRDIKVGERRQAKGYIREIAAAAISCQ